MNIPAELLAEKNYTGTRRIAITNPKIKELKAELKKLQEQINPILDGAQDTFAKLDAAQRAIDEHRNEIKRINEEAMADKKIYDETMAKIQPYEQQALLIKDKLEPLVLKEVESELAEFEKALTIGETEGGEELYVEVQDMLEDFIQKTRQAKEKKTK